VAGLVDYPMNFTVLDMDYMDWTTVTATDPDGVEGQYEGVPLNAIFDYVGVQSDATTMVLTASDGSTVEVALADVPTEESILTVGENDALNTVMPGLDSGWVEDVVKMEFK
jgi:DMSO/TMAO reductase YedYZ molybdopterin-dependent catalytic subunit